MGKKKQTTLTITDLIAKKEIALQAKKPKERVLHIDSLDGNIVITNEGGMEIIDDCMALADTDSRGADKKLVYECVKTPNLKNADLQEAFECVEPIDIVNKLFTDIEISAISQQIMDLYGITGNTGVTVVDDIKN